MRRRGGRAGCTYGRQEGRREGMDSGSGAGMTGGGVAPITRRPPFDKFSISLDERPGDYESGRYGERQLERRYIARYSHLRLRCSWETDLNAPRRRRFFEYRPDY